MQAAKHQAMRIAVFRAVAGVNKPADGEDALVIPKNANDESTADANHTGTAPSLSTHVLGDC